MSGPSTPAPTTYTPTWQGGADQSYQSAIQAQTPYATSLPGQVIPGLQAAANNVVNNPYYAQQQAGANQTAAMAQSTVAPQQFQGASGLQGLGDMATGMAPTATAGMKYAQPLLQQGISQGQQAYGQAQQGIVNLGTTGLQAGMSVLNTAFDPQQALYNQQYQQQQDQQNAIDAQNGVAGSPFAAGLNGQSNMNFNTNWQNQQLARQVQGLGAYDSAASTYAGNLTNLMGTGMSTSTGYTDSGVGQYTNLVNSGITGLAGLTNTAGAAYGGASDLNAAGLNTLSTASALPASTYNEQQGQKMGALTGLAGGTSAALAPLNSIGAQDNSYMQLGQTASAQNLNSWEAQNAANQQSLNNWMSGLGMIGSIAAAPFTGGASMFSGAVPSISTGV